MMKARQWARLSNARNVYAELSNSLLSPLTAILLSTLGHASILGYIRRGPELNEISINLQYLEHHEMTLTRHSKVWEMRCARVPKIIKSTQESKKQSLTKTFISTIWIDGLGHRSSAAFPCKNQQNYTYGPLSESVQCARMQKYE